MYVHCFRIYTILRHDTRYSHTVLQEHALLPPRYQLTITWIYIVDFYCYQSINQSIFITPEGSHQPCKKHKNVAAAYFPEELVGDIGVTDTRIVSHNANLNQFGSDLWFFGRNVNFRLRRIVQKILMNDDEAASIDSEASENYRQSK